MWCVASDQSVRVQQSVMCAADCSMPQSAVIHALLFACLCALVNGISNGPAPGVCALHGMQACLWHHVRLTSNVMHLLLFWETCTRLFVQERCASDV